MKNTIKRANTLNESHYRLKEVTQRVLALAIEQAQHIKEHTGQDFIMSGTKNIIVADYYAQVYEVDRDTAYTALKVAIEDLYQAEYRWKEIDLQNGKVNEYKARFVSRIGYLNGQGAVEFVLTPEARSHILNLTRNFTWYQYRQLRKLSKYGIRLYELLCQYRSTGKMYKTLSELRYNLGLINDEYSKMCNFKDRVLNFAISEILKSTDVEKLSYEQHKQGRTITGFVFSFRFKPKEEQIKAVENNENRNHKTVSLTSLTDEEKKVIQKNISNYINHLEAKGEVVNDFHRKNIENKAIAGRWGLDEYYERLQQAENERQAKQAQLEQERQAFQAEQAQKAQDETKNTEFIAYFESLPQDKQNRIIGEVGNAIDPLFKEYFDEAVANGTAHKDLMYRSFFRQVMRI